MFTNGSTTYVLIGQHVCLNQPPVFTPILCAQTHPIIPDPLATFFVNGRKIVGGGIDGIYSQANPDGIAGKDTTLLFVKPVLVYLMAHNTIINCTLSNQFGIDTESSRLVLGRCTYISCYLDLVSITNI